MIGKGWILESPTTGSPRPSSLASIYAGPTFEHGITDTEATIKNQSKTIISPRNRNDLLIQYGIGSRAQIKRESVKTLPLNELIHSDSSLFQHSTFMKAMGRGTRPSSEVSAPRGPSRLINPLQLENMKRGMKVPLVNETHLATAQGALPPSSNE